MNNDTKKFLSYLVKTDVQAGQRICLSLFNVKKIPGFNDDPETALSLEKAEDLGYIELEFKQDIDNLNRKYKKPSDFDLFFTHEGINYFKNRL